MVASMQKTAKISAAADLDELERQLMEAVVKPRANGDDPLAELARMMGQGDSLANSATPDGRKAPSFDDFLASPVRPTEAPAAKIQAFDDLNDLLPEPASLNLRKDLDGPEAADRAIDALLAPVPAAAQGSAAQASDAPVTGGNAQFDDMLAEFEAAMRDVGAAPAPEAVTPASRPILVPEPIRVPEPAVVAATAPGIAATAVAGAATVATGAVIAAKSRSKTRGYVIAAGVMGVAAIGIGALLMGGGSKSANRGPAAVIAAKTGPVKERPANPGGVDVPNQDKEVFQTRPQTTAQAERVERREEQPVDLTQAQRQTPPASPAAAPAVIAVPVPSAAAPASTAPAQTTAAPASSTSGVRQIPGVAAVNPPPPAAAQPQPRPVASVPIAIGGQPAPVASAPATPVVPAPVAAAPVSPPAATPDPVAAQTPPLATRSIQAAAPPVVASPAASAPPAAPAEPRRVRAVPIRSDNEPAPQRAQAQPRIVAAAPRTPEPDAENAPLRILPSAQRPAAAQPQQRVASAAAAPTTTASSGGSFSVQLAAEGSQDAAQAKFNRMRSQHSGVLGSMSPSIRSADVNGRSVYRVRVGSMSRDEATSLCERLKSDGGNCFVARN
jgi:SPOR domain